MNKSFLIWGSLLACIGVVLGAFGAHALKARLAADQLQVFETAVRYQMYHAFALILLFIIGGKINSPLVNYSGLLIITGTILFSGSLYLLAAKDILNLDSMKMIIGPVTPIGGLCLISGWICLIFAATRFVSSNS